MNGDIMPIEKPLKRANIIMHMSATRRLRQCGLTQAISLQNGPISAFRFPGSAECTDRLSHQIQLMLDVTSGISSQTLLQNRICW